MRTTITNRQLQLQLKLLDLEEFPTKTLLATCFDSNSGPLPEPKLLGGGPMNGNGHYVNDPFDVESEIRQMKSDIRNMKGEI